MATAIAYLTESLRLLFERCRFFVLEVVRSRARRALRSLYPEPGTTCVEDQLVRFLFASEVHSGKNLDVEEVGQVFLQEPLTVFWGSVSLAVIVEGKWNVEIVSRFNVNVKLYHSGRPFLLNEVVIVKEALFLEPLGRVSRWELGKDGSYEGVCEQRDPKNNQSSSKTYLFLHYF